MSSAQPTCFRLLLAVDEAAGLEQAVVAAGLGWRADLRRPGLSIAPAAGVGRVLELVVGDCACDIYATGFDRVTELAGRLIAGRRRVQLLLLASVREPDLRRAFQHRTVRDLRERGVGALPVGAVVEVGLPGR